jgi:hypothetical protein
MVQLRNVIRKKNLMKVDKVNAPPPKSSNAFSLTKTGGRINSDKKLPLR